MSVNLAKRDKRYLRLGIVSVRIAWSALIMLALLVLIVMFGGAFRITIMHVSFARLFVATVAVFLLSAGLWLVSMFRVKCPECDWMLLRNPKGMGPSGFQAHLSCAKIRGFSAWSYQIMHASKADRFKCIRCGAEYEIG